MRTVIMLLLSVVLLPACQGYKLQGRVVRGEYSSMTFVDADDPRLRSSGVPGTTIVIDNNADTLGRETVATGQSDGDGQFSIPVTSFGAGWLEETWALRATRSGFQGTEILTALPSRGSGKLLLIQLAPGPNTLTPLDDTRDHLERFGQ